MMQKVIQKIMQNLKLKILLMQKEESDAKIKIKN